MRAPAALLLLWTSVTAEQANELYQAKEYAGAAAAYASLAREQPKNPLFAFRQGASLLALGRGGEAAPLFDQAAALGFPKPLMKAWSARAQVQMGRIDAAYEALEWAARAGFSDLAQLDGEPAFAPLRSDPRFAALRMLVDRNARPCSHDPEFRQLDFWVGDWEVTSAGALAGTSHVEKILNDCVLLENWTGTLGISGKSFNVWDAKGREWRQTWVDSAGTITEYHGAFGDGRMVLLADVLLPGPDGRLQPARQRMTFFDQQGTVRQLGERSSDGGDTWSIVYDLLYTRSEKQPPGGR